MKKINWENIDEKIRSLKFPLTFIYNILNLQDNINDNNLSLLLRFFLKNHINLALDYPIIIIINMLDDKFENSKKVVREFYSSFMKKILFSNVILNFQKKCNNKQFIKLNINDKKVYIESILNIFKAHFDSSITGLNGVTKFVSQLKFNKEYINWHIQRRVFESISLFGLDFLKNNNIKFITEDEYEKLSIEDKIKFIITYYLQVEKTIKIILNIYDMILIYDNKLKQIINPKPIDIIIDTIYSENDSEDFNLLLT